VIVEFTGLPGSGKSTLSMAVQEVLLSRGYEVLTSFECKQVAGLIDQHSGGNRLTAILNNIIITVKCIMMNIRIFSVIPWWQLVMGNSIRDQIVILTAFFKNLVERDAINYVAQNNTIVLMDEGLFHRAYSLFVPTRNSLNLFKVINYGRTIWLPHLLIYLKPSILTSLHRMQKRGVPIRMKRLKAREIVSMLVRGEAVLDILVETAIHKPSAKFDVIILNGEDVEGSKQKILDWFDVHFPPTNA
jgi:thymidylate kinase